MTPPALAELHQEQVLLRRGLEAIGGGLYTLGMGIGLVGLFIGLELAKKKKYR